MEKELFIKPVYEVPEIPKFDEKSYKQIIEERNKKWEEFVEKQRQQILEDFFNSPLGKKIKEKQKISKSNRLEAVRFKNDLERAYPWLAAERQAYVSTVLKNVEIPEADNYFDDINDYNLFLSYYIKRNRDRVKKLPDDLIKVEIAQGGVFNQNYVLKSFLDGLKEQATLGLYTSTDPIYGEKYKELYSSAYKWGSMAGHLLAFIGLSKICAMTGLTTKLGQILSKPKIGRALLKTFGYPKYLLGKIFPFKAILENGIIRFGWRTFIKKGGVLKAPVYGTPIEAGVVGLSGATIGAIMEGIQETVNRFKKEDELSLKRYKRSLPRALYEGFFQKYFAGLINDPQYWPARFIGDAVYSMGQQIYNIVIGEQDKINAETFWRSFIEGHLLGEIQGIIFRPSKTQVMKMLQDDKIRFYAKKLSEITGDPPEKHFIGANMLWQSELQFLNKKGRLYTEAERTKAVESFKIPYRDYYDIIKQFDNPNLYKITDKFVEKHKEIGYKELQKTFKLTTRQTTELKKLNALDNSKILIKKLTEYGKLKKEIKYRPPKNLYEALEQFEKTDYSDFAKEMNNILSSMVGKQIDITDILFRPQGTIEKVIETQKATETIPIPQELYRSEIMKKFIKEIYNNMQKEINYIKANLNKEYRSYAEDIFQDSVEAFIKGQIDIFNKTGKPKKISNLTAYFHKIVNIQIKKFIKNKINHIPAEEIEYKLPDNRIRDFMDKPYQNELYTLLLKYLNQAKTINTKRTRAKQILVELLSQHYTTKKIVDILKLLDIEATEAAVGQWKHRIEQELRKLLKAPLVKEKTTDVSKEEINIVKKKIMNKIIKYNKITGARIDLDEQLMAKNGSAVISVELPYRQLLADYGKTTADSFLQKSYEILQNIIEEANNNLEGIKRIYLRNPVIDDSTKFVIYHRNLDAQHFNDIIIKIYNDFINNRDNKYGIVISTPQGNRLITNFKKISVIIGKEKNIIDIVRKIDGLKQLVSVIDPVYSKIIDNYYFDLTNKDLINFINDLDKLISLSVKPIDNWNELLKNEKLRAEIYDRLDNIYKIGALEPFIFIDNNELVNKTFSESLNKQERINQLNTIEHLDYIEDTIGNEFAKQVKQGIADNIALLFNKAYNNVTRPLRNKFFSSLLDWIKQKFSVTEGLEYRSKEFFERQAFLYKLATMQEKADLYAKDVLNLIYYNFAKKIGQEAFEAYRYTLDWLIENERQILLKATPKDLEKPIKWKTDLSKDFENPDFLRQNPQDALNTLYKASSDDLRFSKLLVQFYNIPAKDLLDNIKLLDEKWLSVVERATVKADDINYDYFQNVKDKLSNDIIDKLIKYTEFKLTENDLKFSKMEDILQLADTIKNEQIKNNLKQEIISYYAIDPSKLSWTHHYIIQAPDNRKKFSTFIERLIKGKPIKGIEAVNPYMRLFRGRKIPTLHLLTEAGYRIEPDGFKNLIGSMNYFWLKLGQREVAKNLKIEFLNRFATAYEAALEAKDPKILLEFFKNLDAYVYIPTKFEIKRLNERIDKLKTSLNYIPDDEKVQVTRDIAILETQKQWIDVLLKVLSGEDKTFKFTPEELKATFNIGDDYMVPAHLISFPLNSPEVLRYKKSKLYPIFETLTKVKPDKKGNPTGQAIKEGLTLENYEGLYFHRVFWKGMRNWVLKSDTIYKDYSDYWKTTALRFWGNMNRFLKIISFYKFTIITFNDLVQMGIMNPKSLINIPFGFKSAFFKDEWYRKFAEYNLYNNSVDLGPLLTETTKAMYRIMEKKPVLGLITDRILNKKGVIKKIGATAKFFWDLQQNLTWYIDKALRTAAAKTMYDAFIKIYPEREATLRACEYANLFMVKYSQLPRATRQALNLIAFVPTYRIQTWRMYKEMIKAAGRGIIRVADIRDEDPIYKISENRIRQGIFEIAPFLRAIAMKATIKAILYTLFGYGFQNIFDVLFGYRVSKLKRKETLFDTELHFLSMSTPLFDIEKILTRPLTVTLKFNMARFPGLIFSLASNNNLITGAPIVTSKHPKKALAQLGMYLISTYLPFAQDFINFSKDDLTLMEKIINFSGIGFFYNYKSPHQVLEDFRKALNENLTLGERESAINRFRYEMRRAYEVLFKKEYKEYYKRLEEADRALKELRLRED